MAVTIPLTDDEAAAVETDSVAVDRLLERLADVPTPAGPTPRALGFTPLRMAGSTSKTPGEGADDDAMSGDAQNVTSGDTTSSPAVPAD